MKAFVYKAPRLKKMHKETKFEQEKIERFLSLQLESPTGIRLYAAFLPKQECMTCRIMLTEMMQHASRHDVACHTTRHIMFTTDIMH